MSDLAEQIDALLALNAKGAVSHPVPGLAVELLERARNTLSSLPPVDGLEVVATAWKYMGEPSVAFVVALDKHGIEHGHITDIRPLVTLSQASSVIAGLKAELVDVHTRLGELIDEDKQAWAKHGATEIALGQQKAKTEAAEARISSLEEENRRLREALGNAERSFNNIRGAIESNQVVDKDAHGTAIRARDAARQALEDHNG